MPKLPAAAVLDLERAQHAAELADVRAFAARTQLRLLMAQLERDHGFRFAPGTSIDADGTVHSPQPEGST